MLPRRLLERVFPGNIRIDFIPFDPLQVRPPPTPSPRWICVYPCDAVVRLDFLPCFVCRQDDLCTATMRRVGVGEGVGGYKSGRGVRTEWGSREVGFMTVRERACRRFIWSRGNAICHTLEYVRDQCLLNRRPGRRLTAPRNDFIPRYYRQGIDSTQGRIRTFFLNTWT